MIIQASSPTFSGPCLQLYAPNGVLVASACGGNQSARIDATLPAQPGTYKILVTDGTGSGDSGAYTLAFQCLSGSCLLPLPTCGGLNATLVATPEDNVLIGTPGNDVILSLGGNDVIYGLGGNDVICGGSGDDRIAGGPGNDRIFGETGNNVLQGDSGNYLLRGGDGNDTLNGGTGNDQLFGDPGNDTIDGGFDINLYEGHTKIWERKGDRPVVLTKRHSVYPKLGVFRI